MSDSNKQLVRRCIEEAVNKGNFNVVDELVSPDYIYREPTVGEKRGRAGYRELITMYRNAFADLKLTIDEQIAEGNTVITRWTAQGTHRGELMGVAPTGKHVRVQGMIATRIVNGKVTEEDEVYDVFGMLRQIGALPAALGKAA
jgi:steroid delta-isomerase-like uncharacterized protein